MLVGTARHEEDFVPPAIVEALGQRHAIRLARQLDIDDREVDGVVSRTAPRPPLPSQTAATTR